MEKAYFKLQRLALLFKSSIRCVHSIKGLKFKYMTLVQMALPGLHDRALDKFKTFTTSDYSVLDLGSGQGAWPRRLLKEGYKVVGTDLDENNFLATEVPFKKVDLNQEFSNTFDKKFDAITSLEVIAHVENPRNFLRECKSLIKEDGDIFITTPNIENIPGRIRFFLRGMFRQVDRDSRFNDLTIISPIHSYLFEKMLNDCDLKLVDHDFNSSVPTNMRLIVRLINFFLAPFLTGVKGGDTHFFHIKNK